MPSYQRGDVVLVIFPWTNTKGKVEWKTRPGIVYDVGETRSQAIIQITTKNRSDHLPGIWVLHQSTIGKKMGLLQDSFINVSQMLEIHEIDIKKENRIL